MYYFALKIDQIWKNKVLHQLEKYFSINSEITGDENKHGK